MRPHEGKALLGCRGTLRRLSPWGDELNVRAYPRAHLVVPDHLLPGGPGGLLLFRAAAREAAVVHRVFLGLCGGIRDS